MLSGAVGYTLIPLAGLLLGAMAAVVRPPGPRATSAIQHFAAGVVFAAAASEILPGLKHQGAALPIAIGGALGVAAMLLVKEAGRRAGGSAGLAAIGAVDILIDGLVLGIGFVAGQQQGLLLTVALTLEVVFLGLTTTLALRERIASRVAVLSAAAGIGLLLPVGGFLGSLAGTLPRPYLDAFFAFGLVALLYLVTEELLVEAHEQPETPAITAAFFVGFLALLVLEEAL
ncbi:ZIP family metal transporter [Roseicella aerolata]|uniref:Transporter n=1 Tax=Roseicella aerolata TaxID=2883479 RepID=A0A9X1IJ35_9PROT|nr:transporter [Roseicella aerolata]MCB4824553.1 transporter [Roseicella aerolata]